MLRLALWLLVITPLPACGRFVGVDYGVDSIGAHVLPWWSLDPPPPEPPPPPVRG